METNGGATDSTEKICSILRSANLDLRVIVPRRAKSNGTVIAFCGDAILMGPDSELGPIDPFLAGVPADYIVKAQATLAPRDPILVQAADSAIKQTKRLATYLLETGMLKGKDSAAIEATVQKLASRDAYHSHGAVIDLADAKTLGLNIVEHTADSQLWRQIWLLRTMYSFDCVQRSYSKLFENERISSPVVMPRPASA